MKRVLQNSCIVYLDLVSFSVVNEPISISKVSEMESFTDIA